MRLKELCSGTVDKTKTLRHVPERVSGNTGAPPQEDWSESTSTLPTT